MQQVETVIHAKWVLPISPENIALEHHSVIIDQGKIIHCLPTAQCKTQYQGEFTHNLTDHVVMPGLINNHTHAPMNLFRGLADDIPLMNWLNNHMWPAEKAVINKSAIEIGSILAIAEMIRGGTTCFNDHYLFPVVTAHKSVQSGIRSSIGLLINNVENQCSKNEEEALLHAETTLKSPPITSPLLSWTLAPHSPYTVSNEAFKKIKLLSQQYKVPVHIHLHETQNEINLSLKEFSQRPIERLHQLGLIDASLIAVHAVHLNKDEISLLAQQGSHVVHSPQSNLKLGSGIAPISEMFNQKINLSIGTDGAASNNDLDMFSEMQTASLLSKGVSNDPSLIKAQDILAMATLNAARALGIDEKVGSIEPGKEADIIAIKTDDYWQTPIFNPFSHLVYSSNRLSVSDVWVRGRMLMQNHSLTTIDIEKLKTQLNPLLEKIRPFMYIK